MDYSHCIRLPCAGVYVYCLLLGNAQEAVNSSTHQHCVVSAQTAAVLESERFEFHFREIIGHSVSKEQRAKSKVMFTSATFLGVPLDVCFVRVAQDQHRVTTPDRKITFEFHFNYIKNVPICHLMPNGNSE